MLERRRIRSYPVSLAVTRSSPLVVRLRASLGRIDPLIDWPQGFVRFGVAASVAIVVGLGFAYFASAVDRLDDDAGRNAAANYDDRSFGGGNALGVNQEALNQARSWIPENDRYRLLVGPHGDVLGAYARYFLMPRRPDPDARWVLCYGCNVSALGDDFHIVWQNEAGIALGRLPG